MPLPRLTRPATVAAGRAVVSAAGRRTYWSFRCARAQRSPYQYWTSTSPSMQRAWHRHWGPSSSSQRSTGFLQSEPLESSEKEAADNTTSNASDVHSGPKSQMKAEKPVIDDNHVQSEEQRYLANEWAEWERAARAHAHARLDLLRMALEKDPYSMMFGGREARGVWNPWRHGFWRWPSLLERWGRKSMGAEYPDSEAQSISNTMTGDKTPLSNGKDHTNGQGAARSQAQVERHGSTTAKNLTESASIPSVQAGDSYIDLITLRKVQATKVPTQAEPGEPIIMPPPASSGNPGGSSIPVKTFRTQNSEPNQSFKGKDTVKSSAKTPVTAASASEVWLKREGFSVNTSDSVVKSHPYPQNKCPTPAPKVVHDANSPKDSGSPPLIAHTARVQSVLDRWPPSGNLDSPRPIQSPEKPLSPSESKKQDLNVPERSGPLRERVVYEPKENTRDDVDLLRACDIRAASGKIKQNQNVKSTEEISKRRNKLASEFAQSQRKFDISLRKEIIDALKTNVVPTKSPLWALWMQYDHAGSRDWAEWCRRGTFTHKSEQEMKDMQYMSQAFLEQMPSPSEIFASGGTGLSRYLDANRISLSLRSVQQAMNRWHMEMQSILVSRGVQPFSEDVLDNIRKALVKYHIELRRQILSGKGPQIIRTKDLQKGRRQAATHELLVKEVADQRAAMQHYEEKPRFFGNQSGGKSMFVPWTPPGTAEAEVAKIETAAQVQRDMSLTQELQSIYESKYGTITPRHRQVHPKAGKTSSSTSIRADPLARNEPKIQNAGTANLEGLEQPVAATTPLPAPELNPSSKTRCQQKSEATTVLLTLDRLTGALTMHPAASWPVLKMQPSLVDAPLEAPAVSAFLHAAKDPQDVLRKLFGLQARGYRLISGRKGCLILQQLPLVDSSASQLASACSMSLPSKQPLPVASPPGTTPISTPTPTPIPSVTSTESPPPPSANYTSTIGHQSPDTTSMPRAIPSPKQPIHRSEPHFSGRPTPSRTELASAAPSPAYNSGSFRSDGRRERHRRRRGRRTVRFLGSLLRSAMIMAGAAYLAGLWLEWRRERRLLIAQTARKENMDLVSSDSWATRDSVSETNWQSKLGTHAAESGSLSELQASLDRWWERVWWLGQGDLAEERRRRE